MEGGKHGISLMEYKRREKAQKAAEAGSVVHVLIFLAFIFLKRDAKGKKMNYSFRFNPRSYSRTYNNNNSMNSLI